MDRKRFHAYTVCALAICLTFSTASFALTQDPVTSAFEGRIINFQTGEPIPGALLQFIHQTSEARIEFKTDEQGNFYQGMFQPVEYLIKINAWGFNPYERMYTLTIKRGEKVVPLAIQLEPQRRVKEAYLDEARQHAERGQAYAAQRLWKRAIEEFNGSLALYPQNATVYNARGLAWMGMSDFPRATRDFSRAIHFAPNYAEAYANRGIAQLRQGNTPQASKNFTRSKELDKQMKAYIEKALSKQ